MLNISFILLLHIPSLNRIALLYHCGLSDFFVLFFSLHHSKISHGIKAGDCLKASFKRSTIGDLIFFSKYEYALLLHQINSMGVCSVTLFFKLLWEILVTKSKLTIQVKAYKKVDFAFCKIQIDMRQTICKTFLKSELFGRFYM